MQKEYCNTWHRMAKPPKTVLMLLGKGHGENVHVKVRKVQITQLVTAKLLGMEIDEDQTWKLDKTLDIKLFFL